MSCRILVADDSTPIQKVIKIAFSKYQVEIATAGSLVEAIKECERANPEFVIVDASLPGISMAGDFAKLLNKAPNAAFIVLMGTYDSVREADIRGAGMQTILKKPFDAMELLEASEKLLPGRLNPVTTGTGFTKDNMLPTTMAAPQTPPQPPQSPRGPMPGIPSFLLEEEPPLAPPPPSVEAKLDLTKKGLPAFDLPPGVPVPPVVPQVPQTPKSPVEMQPASPGVPPLAVKRPGSFDSASKTASSVADSGSGSHALISATVEEFLRKELPKLVESAVEKYCNEHFKGLARDVLTSELRRLAEEKARYLVDQ